MKRQVLCVAAVAALAACADTSTAPETAVVPVFSHALDHTKSMFSTHLSGAEEVPPRTTIAHGHAIFHLSKDGTSIRYKLVVNDILNVSQAHIHLGAVGANGGVVVWLYPSAPPAVLIQGPVDGVLGEGEFTAANLVGTLAGMTIADLMAHILAGNAYVNVHTSLYPGGEIRGQID